MARAVLAVGGTHCMTVGTSGEARAASAETWVIEPRAEGLVYRLRELWRYRYLVWYFVSQSIFSMFKGTKLRFLWILLRVAGPIGLTAVVFGGVLKAPSDGLPYFLFFLAGMTTWTVFERGAMFVTRSLERNRKLLKKVYFPRLSLPLAGLSPALMELGFLMIALIGTIGYHLYTEGRWYLRRDAGLTVAAIAVLAAFLFAFALGLWTSVLQARWRDVRYTMRYGMRFWFYFTPVIYPLSHIPEKWRWIAYINPMTPVVECFKWGLVGAGEPSIAGVAAGVVMIGLTLVTGLWFFLSAEAAAVDKL